jgi:single-stranded-DNA-specific exonuclease
MVKKSIFVTMTEKRWIYKPTPSNSADEQTITELAKAINVNPFLATLLWQRNITNFEEAKDFFRPSLAQLHDPFLMKDMEIALQRLEKAMLQQERILIYGDYDVDGTTSVSVFYGFLKEFYPHLQIYIPDRYKEGYGVQQQGIQYAHENGFSLIVTLDCGVKSVELIAEAKELGIDFIVCDHHRPGDELPPAVAVLDPKRNDCPYPYKELTGCGVGFKLLQAYCLTNGIDQATHLFPFLDLMVASIASDIVPITGENRILAHFGLKQLNSNPRIGLKALKDVAGLSGELDITGVVFGLGPRINAAGRIRHADDAVRLLLADNEEDAFEFAAEINKHNSDRKGHDSRMTQEALSMIEDDAWIRNAKSTVLYREDWHKGVVGIVASRCIEKYHRPTIILTKSHDKVAGSARSVPGFDLYDALEACTDHLIQFGGHTFAAGMTLYENQVEAFRKRFDEVVASRILPEQLSPMIEVDMPLTLSAITDKFYNIVRQMQPFGPGNMTPVFVSKNVKLKGIPRVMKEKHLRLEVYQNDSPTFTAIGFSMVEEHIERLMKSNAMFHICYQIEVNEWQGRKSLQLFLKDIKWA